MKAHKLFAKEKNKVDDGDNLDTLSEEVNSWAWFYQWGKSIFGNNHFSHPIHLVVVETVVGKNGHQFNNHG